MADNDENGHTCEECGKSYNKKWRLVEHLRSHTGERPYKCAFEGCGKSYIRPFHLKRHMLSHTGQQPSFECSFPGCTKTYSEKHNLKRHERRSHNNPFKCDFDGCIQAFKKSSQLRRHTCIHTNESPYKCQVEGCGRGFETSTRLRRHMKVHNKGYICSVPGCSEAFDKFSKLRTHICSHGFECHECKKTFPRAIELKLHAEIHSANRKLYECPREGCSRVYTRGRSLKSHIKTYHDGIRPFLCTVEGCGKGFSYKVSLKNHLVLHSQNKIKPKRPPEEKKKPKKKKKPVSLAKRLSGYRSSQSDSSDNLAEMPQKRRKVQSKLQKIASTYKNASAKALSQARAGSQSATHSDTNTTDVAEEVNTSNVARSDVTQVCDTPRNVLTSTAISDEQPAENITAVVDEPEQMQGCERGTRGNLINVAVCGEEPSMSTSTVNGPFASIEENREAEEIESVSCATVSNNSTSDESGIRVALDPFAGLTASLVGCKITNSRKDVSEEVEGGSGEDSRLVDTEKECASSSTVANNSPFTNLAQEQINAQSVLDDLELSSEDEDGEGGMDWESDNSHFVETEHDSAYDFESVPDSCQMIVTRNNLTVNGAEKISSEVLSSEEPTVASSKESVEADESPSRSNLASSLSESERSNTNSKSCKDSNSMLFEMSSATPHVSPVDVTSDSEHRRVDSSQKSASQDNDAVLPVTVGGEKELASYCEEETMDRQEEQRALVNTSSSADEGTTHESATGSESSEFFTSVFDTRDKPTNESGSVPTPGIERGVDTTCGNSVRVRQLSREKAALEESGSDSGQRARGPHVIACNEVHVSRDTNAPKTVTSRLKVAENVSNIGGKEVSLTGGKDRGRNTPQDKNSRNVRAQKSSNKRSAKTPAKKGPSKNSKRSHIASDMTNSQVNGNDIQTTKSSTLKEKPKNTENQGESSEEATKAKFRNRSSIFAHDMQTLELLWNFKGR